jgi:hypothetical protein
MHMQLKRPSPALVISIAAFFVALSTGSYAAIKANSIGAKQIKNNAVRTGEIRDGAVGSADVANNSLTGGDVRDESLSGGDVEDGSLGSGDVGDESLSGGDVQDGSLGGGDVTDESLGTADIIDGSLTGGDVQNESIGTGDVSGLGIADFAGGGFPPQAFARVDSNAGRTLEPTDPGQAPQFQGLVQANVVPGEGGAATGTTCFNTPSRPASAMVTLDNADAVAANRNLVTSVAIDRGEDLGDCPATHNDARVRIVDAATEAAQDARFFVWFLL